MTFEDITDILHEYLDPPQHKFITRVQGPDETTAQYVTEFKKDYPPIVIMPTL